MEHKNVIARERQLEILEKLYQSGRSELLAVYGRRRIGKTFLIQNFFKGRGIFLNVEGVKGANRAVQLSNFSQNLSDTFFSGRPIPPLKSWSEAFTFLRKTTEKMDGRERIVLFFDEFPWLASHKSGFLQAFEYFWNRYMSQDNRVLVVICGSAAAWMIRNVVQAKGGLHGRLSEKIRLQPFTLSETERYLRANGIRLEHKQIVEVYMGIGGVAQYLSRIEPGQSSAQIIEDLCFKRDGYLTNEFFHIYASLFDDYERHIDVVKLLASFHKPLIREEIIKKLKLKSGGALTKVLRELEESGLIAATPAYGVKKAKMGYQLVDLFTLFYFHWIHHLGSRGTSGGYWIKQQSSHKWQTWAGHAFEIICFMHAEQIKNGLGLSGILTEQSQWACRQDSGSEGDFGAQIDLVIDRADGCINLCEVKFCKDEFVIDKDYAKVLERKKIVFSKKTQTRKTLFTTLITPYGAAKNAQYLACVDTQLTMKDLFRDTNLSL